MRIDGKQIANIILEELKKRVKKLKEKNIIPHLAIILIGNDPASVAYVRQKKLKGKKIGAKISILHLPSKVSGSKLLATIEQLSNNNNVYGIIVQQPLPSHINIGKIIYAISPQKDVDGFHPNSKFEMPIVLAVLEILKKAYASTPGVKPRFIDWLKNKKIIVIGKGETGGKPVIQMLKKMQIEYSVIDSKTQNAEKLTKEADIIISAVGKSNVVKPEMIKKGTVLISIGLHKGTDDKLYGDYDEEKIKDIAYFYTPTPGGVGPVNVAMLLKNLIKSSENFSR